MSRITVSRLVDVTKALTTEAGQQLSNFIEYTADLSEQTIRALKNGLTFQDNFKCQVLKVELSHDTVQYINTNKGSIYGVVPLRVVSTEYGIDSFAWYINDSSQLAVKISFTGSPSNAIACNLLVLFV